MRLSTPQRPRLRWGCPMSKRFCLRGHDTEIVGRKPNRHCRDCWQAYNAAYHAGKWATDPVFQARHRINENLRDLRQRRVRKQEQIRQLTEQLGS
jgi:hypothetical protein